MKQKSIFIIYISIFLLFSLSFVVLFHTSLFKNQKILFYRGLIFLVIIFFFSFILLYIFRKEKSDFNFYLSALVFSFSINLCFFVIFPVTFERSVTMYILNTLFSKEGISKIELQKKLIREYVIKNEAVEKRIFEQETTGFVKMKQDKIYLTEKGIQFLKFSKIVKKIFNIN